MRVESHPSCPRNRHTPFVSDKCEKPSHGAGIRSHSQIMRPASKNACWVFESLRTLNRARALWHCPNPQHQSLLQNDHKLTAITLELLCFDLGFAKDVQDHMTCAVPKNALVGAAQSLGYRGG